MNPLQFRCRLCLWCCRWADRSASKCVSLVSFFPAESDCVLVMYFDDKHLLTCVFAETWDTRVRSDRFWQNSSVHLACAASSQRASEAGLPRGDSVTHARTCNSGECWSERKSARTDFFFFFSKQAKCVITLTHRKVFAGMQKSRMSWVCFIKTFDCGCPSPNCRMTDQCAFCVGSLKLWASFLPFAFQTYREFNRLSENRGFRIFLIEQSGSAVKKFGPKSSLKFGKHNHGDWVSGFVRSCSWPVELRNGRGTCTSGAFVSGKTFNTPNL